MTDLRIRFWPEGRGAWLYEEGGRKMRLSAELLDGDRCWYVIYRSNARWESPHENDELLQTDVDAAIVRIVEYYKTKGLLIDVQ